MTRSQDRIVTPDEDGLIGAFESLFNPLQLQDMTATGPRSFVQARTLRVSFNALAKEPA